MGPPTHPHCTPHLLVIYKKIFLILTLLNFNYASQSQCLGGKFSLSQFISTNSYNTHKNKVMSLYCSDLLWRDFSRQSAFDIGPPRPMAAFVPPKELGINKSTHLGQNKWTGYPEAEQMRGQSIFLIMLFAPNLELHSGSDSEKPQRYAPPKKMCN